MIFRIEDSENSEGCHRQYEIPFEQLPQMKISELETYLSNEVRKEINNANDRKLLSYSKSLGICLLKYNKYTDNKLHISNIPLNCLSYYDFQKKQWMLIEYNIYHGLPEYERTYPNKRIILGNFSLDVSNNFQVNSYLNHHIGTGKKKLASPEKDKEVLVMQSPSDYIISQYIDSVYLLYALFQKYGMNSTIFQNLYNKIYSIDLFPFDYYNESEKDALLAIVEYLYYQGNTERALSHSVFLDSKNEPYISTYYNPILQLHSIQEGNFWNSYMLKDYNSNIISEWIWEFYAKYWNQK